ncbi:MAG: aldehyde ferredoxin oxidoreductase C-terminal domain-containing protein, partial [Candidatus Helarchaeota archaeon]
PGKPLELFKTHFHRMGIPEKGIDNVFKPPKKEMGLNVGRLTRYSEDWYTVLTSLGICGRAQINRFYGLASVTEFYNVVTGINLSQEDIRKAAERSWNLLKMLNVREGFSRKDDKFPLDWFKPLKFGKLELKMLDFYGGTEITPEIAEQLIDDYYDERGWDKKTGIPTKEKLIELGLTEF